MNGGACTVGAQARRAVRRVWGGGNQRLPANKETNHHPTHLLCSRATTVAPPVPSAHHRLPVVAAFMNMELARAAALHKGHAWAVPGLAHNTRSRWFQPTGHCRRGEGCTGRVGGGGGAGRGGGTHKLSSPTTSKPTLPTWLPTAPERATHLKGRPP
jgi:hypothetical protein